MKKSFGHKILEFSANYILAPLCIFLMVATPIIVVYNVMDFICSLM